MSAQTKISASPTADVVDNPVELEASTCPVLWGLMKNQLQDYLIKVVEGGTVALIPINWVKGMYSAIDSLHDTHTALHSESTNSTNN
ncbi:hypothetical protein OUZ56_011895 [Daphnia magna]|uniref:Uncharacterized protein n=1 Tax=Daphnia magna TaxID=35525 RepID=A0ABQ9Z1G5_9CRUS|nr:hypothetical protein OUZ56_011895 [Daphnia magna]